MKQITLNIPESKFSFFMKLIQELNFVQVTKSSELEENLTLAQKETWQNIRAGFEELKLAEQGNHKARPVQGLLDELEA